MRRLTTLTHDGDVARELADEAVARLVAEVEAGRTVDNTAAWLFRVGRNLATSRGRRMTVAGRHAAWLPAPGGPDDPEQVAIRGEMATVVHSALAGLSPSERQALLLAAHGYDGREIARIVGRSLLATRTMMCRARSKARASILLAGFGAS